MVSYFTKLLNRYLILKPYIPDMLLSNNHASILKEQLLFDEVWLYSNFEKDIYLDECNYKVGI